MAASNNGHDPDVEAVRFALSRARTLGRMAYYGGLAGFCQWQQDGLEALSRIEARLAPGQLQMPMVCRLPGPDDGVDACPA